MFFKLRVFLISLLETKIKRSSLEFRFLKNAFWTLSSSIFSKLLTLVSLLITARILGQEDYGVLGMIRSTTLTFASFAGLGLGLTATRFVAEFKANQSQKISTIISLTFSFALISGVLFLGIFFFTSDVIAIQVMERAELSTEIKLSSFILFFATLIGAQTGIASGLEAFKTLAITNFIAGFASFPIMILAAYSFGIKGAIIGLCANQFLVFSILHFLLKKLLKENRISFSLSLTNMADEFSLLWKFTMPAFLATLLPVVVLWIGNTWIIKRPDGYNDLAIIDIANQWKEIIMYLPAILGTSVLPILSSMNGSDNATNYQKILKIYLLVMLIITGTMIMPVALFSSELLLLYGFEYSWQDKWVIILYSTSSIFLIAASGLGQVLISRNKMWQGLLLNACWALINLGLTKYFLDKNYGALGLAMAFFISYAVYAIGMYIYSQIQTTPKSAL